MFDALYIGATGMQAQQLNVDTIANNLVNVNTSGFKKGRVDFTNLMVQEASRQLPPTAESGLAAGGLGMGVGVANVSRLFDVADMKKTDSAFDLAIQGDGFLEVSMPDGSRAFTRGGTMKINKDGLLSTQAGQPLKPGILIPENTQTIVVGVDGKVQLKLQGQANLIEAGQLEMVRFSSPGMLTSQGGGLYLATSGSGDAQIARAAEDGGASIIQGFVEGSNVKLVDEMVNLMVAQRAYESSVKVVQASDEMLGLINTLRK